MPVPLNYQFFSNEQIIFSYQAARMQSALDGWVGLITGGYKPLSYYDQGGVLIGNLEYVIPPITKPVKSCDIHFNVKAQLGLINTVSGTPLNFIDCSFTQWGVVQSTGNSFLEIDGVRTQPVFSRNREHLKIGFAPTSIIWSDMSVESRTDPDWNILYGNFSTLPTSYFMLLVQTTVIINV